MAMLLGTMLHELFEVSVTRRTFDTEELCQVRPHLRPLPSTPPTMGRTLIFACSPSTGPSSTWE